MKQSDIAKRNKTIKERTEAARDRLGWFEDTVELRRQIESGLRGDGPYVLPVRGPEEYQERAKYFTERNEPAITALLERAHALPVTTGQRWYSPSTARVGIIADTFLAKSLHGTAEFVHVMPTGWEEQVEGIDMLLVTSAWRGLEGEWWGVSIMSPERDLLLEQIIPAVKARGIPVVFYSKEDPPNYSKFLGIARHCDVILTSAEEMIPRYENDAPDAQTYAALPFGVSYLHHNPLGSMRMTERVWTFAGSWHRQKYHQRRQAAMNIFSGLIDAGQQLYIFDRNSELGLEKYHFPQAYLANLFHAIDHSDLLQLQRLLPVAINLNSVQNSQTMFANRALELQAMGTQIMSNYNAGLNSQFPHILMPDSRVDARDWALTLSDNDIYRAQLAGVRAAFTGNTAFERMSTILESAGLGAHQAPAHRIFVEASDAARFEAFASEQDFEGELTYLPVGERDRVRGSEQGDVVITIDDRDYPRGLAQDLINGFKFVDIDAAVATTAADETRPFEFVGPGELPDAPRATWLASGQSVEEARQAAATAVTVGLAPVAGSIRESIELAAPELTVIVPVYNNGKHLRYKCMASLRRSSIFDRMSVLLIDDGSTDEATLETVRDLEATFPNVTAFLFGDGGSGSASRPRNKGLELAETPYVTYLDPDNEAVTDGYAKLLDKVKETGADFAIGNMVKFKGTRSVVGNNRVLKNVIRASDDWAVDDDALPTVKFQPMSIQALVANTAWLKSLHLVQPVGAVGQDSYFFQQMLYYAHRVYRTSTPIHSYYAEVANSTVNTLGPRFYEKYIPLESDRAAWLKSVGLLEAYNELRLEPFVRGWYIKKLEHVSPEEIDRCAALIQQLAGFYGEHEWQDPFLQEWFASRA